jgi:hypothetical protein
MTSARAAGAEAVAAVRDVLDTISETSTPYARLKPVSFRAPVAWLALFARINPSRDSQEFATASPGGENRGSMRKR